jgi:predicted ester cyclase
VVACQADQRNSDALSSKGAQTMGALETVRAFNEAVNAQQWDRVAGYLTEDFIFSGVTPQPVGKQGFIEGQKAWAAGAPNWHVALENLREEAGVVKADTRISGTQTQLLALPGIPSIPPSGKSFTTTDRMTATLRGDQLASLTVEPSSPGIMEQLGVQRPTA